MAWRAMERASWTSATTSKGQYGMEEATDINDTQTANSETTSHQLEGSEPPPYYVKNLGPGPSL